MVVESLNCAICWEEIPDIVEFTLSSEPQGEAQWFPSLFCIECIAELKKTQFSKYLNDAANVDCEKTMRALMASGPPINIHDINGFPGSNGREIPWVRLSSSGQVSRKDTDCLPSGYQRKIRRFFDW